MGPETARIVFLAVASALFVVWLVGTRFAFSRLSALRVPGPGDAGPGAALDSGPGEAAIAGEARVRGEVEGVSRKIASGLAAAGAPAGLGLIKISERTRERVVFEKAASMGVAPVFDSGVFTLRQEGNEVLVRYAASVGRFERAMRIVAWLLCLVYGGAFAVGVPVLVWHLAVTSDDPKTRWQTLQVVQMIHGVWPPFLMGYLVSKLAKLTRGFFQTLVANLEHVV